ncbi:MAG: hypothetical protein JJ863_15880 [Deltaproteobacteria bacterium]|nr:hypothetical protein [Deltaproteobacteria bacterium]
MSGEVVYERRRRPIDFRVLTVGAGIATIVGAGAALLGSHPELGMVSAIVGGVLTMVFGLLVTERAAFGGALVRLTKTLRLERPASPESYRDSAKGPELVWDDVRIPKKRARAVVVGHFTNHAGGGHSHHFWPLYLVLDDRVVELDVFRHPEEARFAQAELARRLELPTEELGNTRFGDDAQMGCVVGALTIVSQLGTVLVGSMGGLFVGRGSLQALLPTVMVLLLWASTGVMSSLGRKKVRPRVDEEVRETFELSTPRVRVAVETESAEALEVAEGLPALAEREETIE